MAETPEVTPTAEWIVPNQDLIEKVVDQRFAQHLESEKPTTKSTSSRSTSSPSAS